MVFSRWLIRHFQLFCECIERVHRGEIFATTEQLNYLLESVCQVPSLRVVGASGEKLLTSREEQVVALVTDGLSNRDVATELGLSQHTVKNYIFKIFDKLGVSNRVELAVQVLSEPIHARSLRLRLTTEVNEGQQYSKLLATRQ